MRLPFVSGGNKLIPHAARNLLNQRLPNTPDPTCTKCKSDMKDVRPFHIEPVTHGTFKLRCLVRCGHCNTPHIGWRGVGVQRNTSRFLEQEFERYNEAEHGDLLNQVRAKIDAKREKYERIQATSVTDHVVEEIAAPPASP